ncbi:hypothetical protein I4641_04620 [Waterburya agarophytonicola K14]|uniref:Uncharacterized protein n=1 Tax=Waterburya agarophytonicola KI4 TaxID=2874699 RepID=A0A964BNC8_9CYAN|nr:hypothetical protein [Waterburya agarophytonicola]MCC0176259.1 hypothetical protein [Waterburya agarophytonicola KI4]
MELHQKAWLEKRSFILLPNKLKLHLKDSQGEYENYVSYEKLKSEAQIRSRKSHKLFFITIMAMSSTICILLQSLMINQGFYYAIFPSTITLVFAILYQVKKQDYIVVETTDRKRIIFLRDKPNRQALEIFLNQLWLQRKRYLREKYFYIDRNQDLERQTERLRWLLEQKAITKMEFKFAKDDWVIDKSYQSL